MIALYKGKSFFSKCIRLFNWSEYSHAAWIDDDGSVYQAWKDGVTHDKSLSDGHTPGTVVDIFWMPGETPEIRVLVREFLRSQLGKKYDKLGILGFVVRATRLNRKAKWFCSELVSEAYAYAGQPLLRLPSYKVYPGLLAASPMLACIKQEITQ